MTVVVDYGLGNKGSILNMLQRIGHPGRISAVAEEIRTADRLILPGVGAFDRGMTGLREAGLEGPIREAVAGGARLLGICLGAQMLFEGSEEGVLPGLGLIKGRVIKFRQPTEGNALRIPHMGWNMAMPQGEQILFKGMGDAPRFYFVHSYHFAPTDAADVAATTVHGVSFASAVARANVSGVQFHPEKSHRFGMALLTNFSQN
jgi:glutamine amidotransferase